MRINCRKGRGGDWLITKNGKRIDRETSKAKANQAVKYYRVYFRTPKNLRKFVKY